MKSRNQKLTQVINYYGNSSFINLDRIIKMFLEGKVFPSGNLSEEKWRIHVYDITHFVTNEQFLEDLIEFDPEQFFKVIAKIFYGQPYKFL